MIQILEINLLLITIIIATFSYVYYTKIYNIQNEIMIKFISHEEKMTLLIKETNVLINTNFKLILIKKIIYYYPLIISSLIFISLFLMEKNKNNFRNLMLFITLTLNIVLLSCIGWVVDIYDYIDKYSMLEAKTDL
jgi:hypothetical protein